jgi:hypothetical protein
MTIRVDAVLGSRNQWGDKIATLIAYYPRFIHAELMTHKDLSRNASSSRAIPFRTMLKMVRRDMAKPVYWGKNQPGMSASEELTGFGRWFAKFMWTFTGHIVLTLAWLMSFSKVHKQIINRMIEPWSHINVQITATNYERMLGLRLDLAAQPEFQELARAIKDALGRLHYEPLNPGQWHLPWIMEDEQHLDLEVRKRLSAARSARLSYTPIGEPKRNVDKDLLLAADLFKQLHLSPFEHQATPYHGRHANLQGWRSFRTDLGY